ncbi:MAG: hypothetical protein J7M20_06885, partial [Deltaproteobacteria bacterium]|nr:hypothetical protein [Deltaproteobacteria bacterium]
FKGICAHRSRETKPVIRPTRQTGAFFCLCWNVEVQCSTLGLKVFRILIRIMPGSIPNTMPIPTLPRHIQSHQETDV